MVTVVGAGTVVEVGARTVVLGTATVDGRATVVDTDWPPPPLHAVAERPTRTARAAAARAVRFIEINSFGEAAAAEPGSGRGDVASAAVSDEALGNRL
jgi:hypothetical protein